MEREKMTEREKMIEEMENDITENLVKGSVTQLAEDLFDLNYRKVPDGAVVLTKEELESGITFNEVVKSITRKETAREILNAIEKQYQKDNKKTYQDVTTYRCQLARRTETKTETWTRHKGYLSGLCSVEMMIKEKYGVEVEE